MPYKLNKKKYKIHFLNIFDFFLRKFRILKKYKFKLRPKRFEKISKSVAKGKRFIHQGRVWVKLKLSKYHVGYVFGEFACTKKPFIFRPKKKKIKGILEDKLIKLAQIRSTLLHRVPYSMIWNSAIFQKKNDWFYIFNNYFSKSLLCDFLHYSKHVDIDSWKWSDFFFNYLTNPLKSAFYTIYNTDVENYYYSTLYNRFFYMLLLKKNLVLDNTNNVSNISVQGKINFFDLNNNLYCLNAYYLQNFYKIKQKKTKKNKKKNIVKHFKKKNNHVLMRFKQISLSRTFRYLKIKNYKNFIKSQYIDFYLSNFTFTKLSRFLILEGEKYIFSRSYGKTNILLVEKLFSSSLHNGPRLANLHNINTYSFLYSYICECFYNSNLHPIFVLPFYCWSEKNGTITYDLDFNYTNFNINYTFGITTSNIVYL